jgi:hypothetical protein
MSLLHCLRSARYATSLYADDVIENISLNRPQQRVPAQRARHRTLLSVRTLAFDSGRDDDTRGRPLGLGTILSSQVNGPMLDYYYQREERRTGGDFRAMPHEFRVDWVRLRCFLPFTA